MLMKDLRDICEIVLTYLWHIYEIFMKYLWNIYEIFMKYLYHSKIIMCNVLTDFCVRKSILCVRKSSFCVRKTILCVRTTKNKTFYNCFKKTFNFIENCINILYIETINILYFWLVRILTPTIAVHGLKNTQANMQRAAWRLWHHMFSNNECEHAVGCWSRRANFFIPHGSPLYLDPRDWGLQQNGKAERRPCSHGSLACWHPTCRTPTRRQAIASDEACTRRGTGLRKTLLFCTAALDWQGRGACRKSRRTQ